MCITAPWQNRRAVDEQSRRVHKGEQGSRLGSNTVRGAKGQIFLLYLLGIRYHRLVILHLNKICFIVMPLPRHPPQLRVINRLQNILIYIHKCHQNENYPDMNSFCCWCCLMSFKAFCASELYDYSLMYVLFYHIQCLICVIKRGDGCIRGWRGNDHSRSHSFDAFKWLPACSGSFYSVHIYSKYHGYFIKHFF